MVPHSRGFSCWWDRRPMHWCHRHYWVSLYVKVSIHSQVFTPWILDKPMFLIFFIRIPDDEYCSSQSARSSQSAHSAMDWQGLHNHGQYWGVVRTNLGDARVDAGKRTGHGGLRIEDAAGSTSNNSIQCKHQHRTRMENISIVQEQLEGLRAKIPALTRVWVTMFVLGSCWVWNPHSMF